MVKRCDGAGGSLRDGMFRAFGASAYASFGTPAHSLPTEHSAYGQARACGPGMGAYVL